MDFVNQNPARSSKSTTFESVYAQWYLEACRSRVYQLRKSPHADFQGAYKMCCDKSDTLPTAKSSNKNSAPENRTQIGSVCLETT